MGEDGEMPILLHGAPDGTIGIPGGNTQVLQVMQLDMSNHVLEELLVSARSGKQPHIVFGRNPMLRFGSRSHVLESHPSKLRHEVYRTEQESNGTWEFTGLISHSLSIKKAEAVSAGMDAALKTLKNNMAAIEQERQARKTPITSDFSASKKATHLAPPGQTTLSTTPSYDDNDDMLARKFDPVKSCFEADKAEALRISLIHLLALQPFSLGDCSVKIRARTEDLIPLLKKLAEKDAGGNYILANKAYKDLNPWSWNYVGADRQAAIDNAIRAYDRLRVDPKDPIWQNLLPAAERNKGKILSKLKLQPAKVPTPGLKPKILDKKSNLQKRSESKKAEKVTENKLKEKANVKTVQKAAAQHGTSVSIAKSEEKSTRRDLIKDKHSKLNRVANSASPRPVKEPKPSASIKSLLNKPKNPSPLSKSPPVNASDFEDSHPVHKALSAAVSPTRFNGGKMLKRKAQGAKGEGHSTITKRPRLEEAFSVTKVKPSASPAVKPITSTKRKSTEDSSSSSLDSTSLKVRKLAAVDNRPRVHTTMSSTAHKNSTRPRSTTQMSDDSSVTSPDLALSHRERLVLAENFKRSYAKYRKLYLEISNRKEPSNSTRRDELLKMHESLAKMKQQINGGVIR